MAVQDWSTDPAANTTVGPVNIAENCPAANMNNMGREIMAQIKAWADGLPAVYQPKDGLLTALAALTTSADKIIYATGADTVAQTALTAFMRTLLDDTDASAACLTLGAIRLAGISLGNPGYIRFQVGASSFFQAAWGVVSVPANSAISVSYAAAFPTLAVPCPAPMAVNGSGSDNENCGYVSGSGTVNGFALYNANNQSFAVPYIALGC